MSAERFRTVLHNFSLTEALTEVMHGILIFSALIILPQAFAVEYTAVLLAVQMLAYLTFWLIRIFSRQLWTHLLPSLLIIALPFLPLFELPLIPKIILSAGLLFMAIRSFALRISEKKLETIDLLPSQGVALLFFLGLYLVTLRFQLLLVNQAYFYLVIIYLLLALFRYHHISLRTHMDRFINMPSQPSYRIRRFNQMLLLIFAVVLLVLLLIAPVFHLHQLLPLMGSALLALLRWLVSLLSRQGSEPEPVSPDVSEPLPDPSLDGLIPAPTETARWLLILQDILYYVFIFITVAGLLFIVGFTLYRLYRRFYASDRGPDVFESLLPKFKDDLRQSASKTRSRWRRQFGQSPEQKIRRIYWRVVDRLSQPGIEYNHKQSPRQYARLIREQKGIDILAMTRLYERVRYGPGPCSTDDLQQMRTLYQEWKKSKHPDKSVADTVKEEDNDA